MRRLLLPLLCVVGCSGATSAPSPVVTRKTDLSSYPFSHGLSKVEKDNRPRFRIDPEKPWHLEFGRGSGWHGLDTIKLDQDGHLELHRQKENARRLFFEGSVAELPKDAVAKVLAAVDENGLMNLEKMYHADVADGTQWVFWIRQGDREKSVYFNNHFPTSIVRFAEQLDDIVGNSVQPKLVWKKTDGRDHEKEIWDSIRR
jgi:hypothetical protein